jgi:ribose/xylose/arabinose/galactoside ABC-type transport system permease subunit
VSILGGKGGVVGAAIGTLTVNFLNTGLVFNVTPAFMIQLYLGILLMVVIMFQTGSRLFEGHERRKQLLSDVDIRRLDLLARKNAFKPPT